MRGEAILFSNGERHETRQNGRWKDWALRAVAQGSLRDRYREQLGRLLPRPAVKRSPQRRTERRPSLVAPGKPLGPLALAPQEAAKYRAAKSGSSEPGLAAPHERPARRLCRRSDHRHRNYGHRDLRGARSDGSARNGAAVHAASGELFATRLDGDGNCAGDRLLFY